MVWLICSEIQQANSKMDYSVVVREHRLLQIYFLHLKNKQLLVKDYLAISLQLEEISLEVSKLKLIKASRHQEEAYLVIKQLEVEPISLVQVDNNSSKTLYSAGKPKPNKLQEQAYLEETIRQLLVKDNNNNITIKIRLILNNNNLSK